MEPGSKVRVTLKDGKRFEGILIERPALLGKNIIVLKLPNGYNIGIKKAKIKEIKVLKKAKPKKGLEKAEDIGADVTIISTGGTIASMVDYATGGVHAILNAAHFKEMLGIEVNTLPLMNKMSEDMKPRDWQRIARACFREIKKGRSVIVTHGTDTMHFTAAALSFMVATNKPIILTGAQRSSDRPSSDAFLNLRCSYYAAKADIPAVGIVMHETTSDTSCIFIRGVRARKMHTSARYAFKPINDEPIARIWYDGRIEKLQKIEAKEPKLMDKLDDRVALLYVYPGIDFEAIDTSRLRGLVIAGTGLGHVPSEMVRWIKKLDIPVFVTSQCFYGSTHSFVYSNLRRLVKAGAVHCGDMLPEVAYVKLMWVLANFENPQEAMLKNFVGEISV